jgi:hypothetical protein
MPRRVKNAVHHWWPQVVSKFWTDESGHVHRIETNGDLTRSLPKSFGGVKNANSILNAEPSVWDFSFESDFDRADNEFPHLIHWLNDTMFRPSTHGPMSGRISAMDLQPEQRETLSECIASLISRSPSFRNRINLTSEYYRGRFGFSEPKPDKNLVALGVRGAQQAFKKIIGSGGKFVLLRTSNSEFIFGD